MKKLFLALFSVISVSFSKNCFADMIDPISSMLSPFIVTCWATRSLEDDTCGNLTPLSIIILLGILILIVTIIVLFVKKKWKNNKIINDKNE